MPLHKRPFIKEESISTVEPREKVESEIHDHAELEGLCSDIDVIHQVAEVLKKRASISVDYLLNKCPFTQFIVENDSVESQNSRFHEMCEILGVHFHSSHQEVVDAVATQLSHLIEFLPASHYE